jgi:hypothetical protein
MELAQRRPQAILDDELEAFLKEPLDATEPIAEAQSAPASKSLPRWLIGVVFVVGLLLGWLLLGWWLVPVQWTNSAPWQLQPSYQRTYVSMIAVEYARSGNLAEVEKNLTGWDREALKSLLEVMQRETVDPAERQRLAALARILRFPPPQPSVLPSLFSSPLFLLAIFLAVTPLLAALALVAWSRFKKQSPVAEQVLGQEGEAAPAIEDLIEGDETIADVVAEQKKKEEEQQQEQKKEKEEEEEAEDKSSGLGDLASLFEEEDTSLSALEQFCKGMMDVDADALMQSSLNVMQQLRKANQLGLKPASEAL